MKQKFTYIKQFKLPENSFDYCFEYDYDRVRNCDEHRCNEDGICRCSTLENVKIKEINLDSIKNYILEKYNRIKIPREQKEKYLANQAKFNIYLEYGIDRLLRIYKFYETDNWYVNVENGYYGEEIGNCKFQGDWKGFIKSLAEFIKLKPNKKIEFLLKLEYGYLLDRVQDKQFKEEKIDKKLVRFNRDYSKKVSLDLYEGYQLPLGIAIKEDNELRLVDGYHRFLSSKDNKVKMIVAYE